jgi:hypothetical protein
MRKQSTLSLAAAALAAITFIWSSNQGMAAEKAATDPTGTWKIATISPETKSKGSEQTLKLKLEGGKLTGTITGRSSNNGKVRIFEWAIKDSKLQGKDISFTVTHAPVTGEGPDTTTIYEGKIAGESMKGKAETEWAGHTFKRDWEARRVQD